MLDPKDFEIDLQPRRHHRRRGSGFGAFCQEKTCLQNVHHQEQGRSLHSDHPQAHGLRHAYSEVYKQNYIECLAFARVIAAQAKSDLGLVD